MTYGVEDKTRALRFETVSGGRIAKSADELAERTARPFRQITADFLDDLMSRETMVSLSDQRKAA